MALPIAKSSASSAEVSPATSKSVSKRDLFCEENILRVKVPSAARSAVPSARRGPVRSRISDEPASGKVITRSSAMMSAISGT